MGKVQSTSRLYVSTPQTYRIARDQFDVCCKNLKLAAALLKNFAEQQTHQLKEMVGPASDLLIQCTRLEKSAAGLAVAAGQEQYPYIDQESWFIAAVDAVGRCVEENKLPEQEVTDFSAFTGAARSALLYLDWMEKCCLASMYISQQVQANSQSDFPGICRAALGSVDQCKSKLYDVLINIAGSISVDLEPRA